MSRLRRDRTLILGVDAGGTKSEALLADMQGRIVGHGLCSFNDPDSGRGPGGSGRTGDSVRTAVIRALSSIEPDHSRALLVVGRGRLPTGAIPDGTFGAVRFRPVSEQDAALALAGSPNGVVVLAGTGAFVFGRTNDGDELLLDALGPLLGDAGSGFDIGLRALRAAARASWHPRHATSLDGPLQAACAAHVGNPPRFDLVGYMLAQRDRSEIASLAQIVDAHAEAGDRVARTVLCEAADAIAQTLYDVVDRLKISDAALPMVAAGSVARKSRLYWERVCERAQTFAPKLMPVVPEAPDVVGMLIAGSSDLDGLSVAFDARVRDAFRTERRSGAPTERYEHAIQVS